MKTDLNCDIGENEPFERSEGLMRQITSANIACGSHAGDVDTMRQCIRLALQYGVRIGAHPGLADPQNFGRLSQPITPARFELSILHQVCALETLARTGGAVLHHIKLHGALYHLAENDFAIRDRLLHLMQECWPSTILYALAGGTLAQAARDRGLLVWEEIFLDRNYLPDGTLVPRDQPNALLEGESEALDRLELLKAERKIKAVDGSTFPVQAQTVGLHADSPNALGLAVLARVRIA